MDTYQQLLGSEMSLLAANKILRFVRDTILRLKGSAIQRMMAELEYLEMRRRRSDVSQLHT